MRRISTFKSFESAGAPSSSKIKWTSDTGVFTRYANATVHLSSRVPSTKISVRSDDPQATPMEDSGYPKPWARTPSFPGALPKEAHMGILLMFKRILEGASGKFVYDVLDQDAFREMFGGPVARRPEGYQDQHRERKLANPEFKINDKDFLTELIKRLADKKQHLDEYDHMVGYLAKGGRLSVSEKFRMSRRGRGMSAIIGIEEVLVSMMTAPRDAIVRIASGEETPGDLEDVLMHVLCWPSEA